MLTWRRPRARLAAGSRRVPGRRGPARRHSRGDENPRKRSSSGSIKDGQIATWTLMILLDSDHLSVLLDERDARSFALSERLHASEDEIALPIVCMEEFMRGWLS